MINLENRNNISSAKYIGFTDEIIPLILLIFWIAI